MRDAHAAALAGTQFNRVTRDQLVQAGLTPNAIAHRVATGRLVIVEQGVLAFSPLLEGDDWGRWMGATLTAPPSMLSQVSACVAYGALSYEGPFTTVTRPGSGGARRHGNVLVYRSTTVEADRAELRGIPITSIERALLDISMRVGVRARARAVRESVRLGHTTLYALGDALGRYRGRRGVARLGLTVAAYRGLPLERAKSGAEIRAMEVLRDAGISLPRLNHKVAGEEADLSWPDRRLIIEIDGGPFHLDVGADARKEAAWCAAGWTVRRLPSDGVYELPHRLIDLATANVPR